MTVESLGLHRYPDPHQEELKKLFCRLRNTHAHSAQSLTPANLFVGTGSDEAIDNIMRCFCVPGRDRILVCPPTYGMYAVSATINDVGLVKIPLGAPPAFDLDVAAILAALSGPDAATIKAVFICTPGNPTAALIPPAQIAQVLAHPTWNGVVVLDEAYIDFAPDPAVDSLAEWVLEYPNLVVMQTLSKGFGCAGIRCGVAFTSPPIAKLMNGLKAPYNVPEPTSVLACQALGDESLGVMRRNREQILRQRDRLLTELPKIPGVGRFRGGRESNFLLVELLDVEARPCSAVAVKVYEIMAARKGVVVRFRGNEMGCLGCLRITVGTEDEVSRFLVELKDALATVRSAPLGNQQVLDKQAESANAVVA